MSYSTNLSFDHSQSAMHKHSTLNIFNKIKSETFDQSLSSLPYHPKRKQNVKMFQEFIKERHSIQDKIKKNGERASVVLDGIIRMFKLNKQYQNNDLQVEQSHNLDWKKKMLENSVSYQDLTKKNGSILKENKRVNQINTNLQSDEGNYEQAIKRLMKMSLGVTQYDKYKDKKKQQMFFDEIENEFQVDTIKMLQRHQSDFKANKKQPATQKKQIIKSQTAGSKRFLRNQQIKMKTGLSKSIFKSEFIKSNKANRLQMQIHQILNYAQKKKGLKFPKSPMFQMIDQELKQALLAVPNFQNIDPNRYKPKQVEKNIRKRVVDYSVPNKLLRDLQFKKDSRFNSQQNSHIFSRMIQTSQSSSKNRRCRRQKQFKV